ncbi:hypothetical protein FRC03_007426 [Tulasnella sp. 419]|nr:hypothetical protein FRC03_007426 [Tulasnella sp. 419]
MTSSHQPIASDTLGGHQKLSHQVQEQKSQLWEKIPKDNDELARFEYQNRAITLVAGFRNDLIRSALAPNPNRTPTAAEFSYISGSW